jgi:hypothetical protein
MVAVAFILTLLIWTPVSSNTSFSLTRPTARVFDNCTAMHRVFPGGVARPGVVNEGGNTRYAPKVSRKLYNANRSMDRDKDGIACER